MLCVCVWVARGVYVCESVVRVSQLLFRYPVLPNSSTGMCCKPNQRQQQTHIHIYKHTRIHTYICMRTHMHIHMHVYIFLCDYVSESTLTARGPRKLSGIKNFKFVIKIGPHTDADTHT